MRKILIVDKEGKVNYDGDKILRSDINSKFLYDLFKNALNNEVDFKIDESDPISILFKRIKEETAADSQFAKQISSLKFQYKENITEKTIIENAEIEGDLPF